MSRLYVDIQTERARPRNSCKICGLRIPKSGITSGLLMSYPDYWIISSTSTHLLQTYFLQILVSKLRSCKREREKRTKGEEAVLMDVGALCQQ